MMDELESVAYQYGRAVAWRECFADNVHAFEALNQDCMRLWLQLIKLEAYVDEEHSILTDEAREHYIEGMNSVPTRMRDFDGTDWQEDHDE